MFARSTEYTYFLPIVEKGGGHENFPGLLTVSNKVKKPCHRIGKDNWKPRLSGGMEKENSLLYVDAYHSFLWFVSPFGTLFGPAYGPVLLKGLSVYVSRYRLVGQEYIPQYI